MVEERYLEDYPQGSTADFGGIAFTADEIREFAGKWDPQPFHLGDGGPNSPFGGLAASGWHTAATVMRVLVEKYISEASSMGSPGLDIRWTAPVKPGDVLSAHIEVMENRRSQTKPDRGILVFDLTARNQNDVVVMTIHWTAIMRARPAK